MHLSLPGEWLTGLPDIHDGLDRFHSQRSGHRDSVVPIPHKVAVAYLDQRHGWQVSSLLPGRGNAQPALTGVVLKRVELAVKVGCTALAAADLRDSHRARPAVAAGSRSAVTGNLLQREQLSRASSQA